MKTLKNYITSIYIKLFFSLSLLVSLSSCVEEIELRTQDFESLLVIEANITNELKPQVVKLSRTFRFEDDGPSRETGATVNVLANGSQFASFSEAAPGRYVSTQPFAAQAGVDYTLEVTTRNGRKYVSTPSQLADVAQIESITAQPSQDSFGNQGVSILVNSNNSGGQGNFYKFEYEETYKIIAPFWRIDDLAPDDDEEAGPCDVMIVDREQEERVCYNTVNSINIVLADTNGQPEDRLNNFEAKFISKDNVNIAHRYSILLKQHVISAEAHNYFKRRRDLAIDDNLFSQAQPGFLEGNITSVQSPGEERVIGVFYVSTVSEMRYFFSWNELFPGQTPPQIPCQITAPPLVNEAGNCVLANFVINNQIRYWQPNESPQAGEGPHRVVSRECGDCTASGSNIIPDFWEE